MIYTISHKVDAHQESKFHLIDVVLPSKIKTIKGIAVYASCDKQEQNFQLGVYSVSINNTTILLANQKFCNLNKINKHSLNHLINDLVEDYNVTVLDNIRVVVSEIPQQGKSKLNYLEYTIKIIIEYD